MVLVGQLLKIVLTWNRIFLRVAGFYFCFADKHAVTWVSKNQVVREISTFQTDSNVDKVANEMDKVPLRWTTSLFDSHRVVIGE